MQKKLCENVKTFPKYFVKKCKKNLKTFQKENFRFLIVKNGIFLVCFIGRFFQQEEENITNFTFNNVASWNVSG